MMLPKGQLVKPLLSLMICVTFCAVLSLQFNQEQKRTQAKDDPNFKSDWGPEKMDFPRLREKRQLFFNPEKAVNMPNRGTPADFAIFDIPNHFSKLQESTEYPTIDMDGDTIVASFEVAKSDMDGDSTVASSEVAKSDMVGDSTVAKSECEEENDGLDTELDAGNDGEDYGDDDDDDENYTDDNNVAVDDHLEPTCSRPYVTKLSTPCRPCDCVNLTKRNLTAAICKNKHLLDIPPQLPQEISELYFVQNSMQKLNTADLLHYPALQFVSVNRNYQLNETVNSSSTNKTSDIVVLDLRCNGIRTVADGSFAFMQKLQNLTLRGNRIVLITNFTFEGLGQLRFLELADNRIRYIEYGAFDHLKRLEFLNLARNRRLGLHPKRFAPRLFIALTGVTHLFIEGNSNGEEDYPTNALQKLNNLRMLSIDGLARPKQFGPEMAALKHFTHLRMGLGGHCFVKKIHENYFQNTPYLNSIELYRCRIKSIDAGAFTKLQNLSSLTISHMRNYRLSHALSELRGLEKSTSLKILRLVHLFSGKELCLNLTGSEVKFLKNMHLEELDLSQNRLVLLYQDAVPNLPLTLKRLILNKNKFTVTGTIINRIKHLKNLEELDLSEQNLDEWVVQAPHKKHIRKWCDKIPVIENIVGTRDVFPDTKSKEIIQISSEGFDDARLISSDSFDLSPAMDVKSRTDKSITSTVNEFGISHDIAEYSQKYTILDLPKKLRVLKARRYNNLGMVLFSHVLPNGSSLEYIDFSDSYATHWGAGRMPLEIKTARLENNFAELIESTFFRYNNSLENLFISNNYLGSCFEKDRNGSIFANLRRLVVLDISMNMISWFPYNFFNGLTSLQCLNVSNNKLGRLNTRFSHMIHLKWIDLSKNSIIWISRETRSDWDIISSNHPLTIDLTSNPLPCTCTGIEILVWMLTTNAILYNQRGLDCYLENGAKDNIGDLEFRIKSLQLTCAPKAIIIVGCLASFAIVGFSVGFAMLYRYRWKLRYLRNIAMAKLIGFKPKKDEKRGFLFDAYIIYSEESLTFVVRELSQELEERRGHKLCIPDRDFLPGSDIISGIVSAILHSNKTVVVLSREIFDDSFSEYSIKMALMEEIHKRRTLLHLCLYQVDPEEMSRDMLLVMKRNDYSEVPPENEGNGEIRQNFWDQLSQAIGHIRDE